MRHIIGFTIIELLVVITIIVVLLAMLTPALDRAVYQAEFLVCASNLSGAAGGVTLYAFDHQRRYPARDAYRLGRAEGTARPNMMTFGNQADDMQRLEGYVPFEMLIDPFNKGLTAADMDRERDLAADSTLLTNYPMWFDWQYSSAGGGASSSRIGQGFAWLGHKYNLLISDFDLAAPTLGGHYHNSHPGKTGMGTFQLWLNQPLVGSTGTGMAVVSVSRWISVGEDLVDMNFAHNDGSVSRINDVTSDDDRLDHISTDSQLDPSWVVSQHIKVPR